MKEFNPKHNLLMAGIIMGAEACTPNSVITQADKTNSVDTQLMQEAIECVLKATPGKTVVEVRDGIDKQREVFMENEGNKYKIDLTKTYPKSYDLQMYGNKNYLRSMHPYMIIYEMPKEIKGLEDLKLYFDGISKKPYNSQEKLDGKVDYATDEKTETENAQTERLIGKKIVEGDSYAELVHGLNQYQFETKRDIWQKDYNKAIKQISEGCKKNK